MGQVNQNSIPERIARLEQQNARLAKEARWAKRLAAVAALGLLIAVAAGAMQEPQAAVVSRLAVVGPNGKERIVLFVDPGDGSAKLMIQDGDGDPHVMAVTDSQGAATFLRLRDKQDKERITLGVDANGSGLLIDGQAH